jgi:hypothetical protein
MGGLKNAVTVRQGGQITSLRDVTFQHTIVRGAYGSDKQQVRLTVKDLNGVAYDGTVYCYMANHAGVKYLRNDTAADGTKVKDFALVSEKGTGIWVPAGADSVCELEGIPNSDGEFFVEIDNSAVTKTSNKDVYVVFTFADKSVYEKFKLNPA